MDLEKLGKEIDILLKNETEETLTKWLNERRNNFNTSKANLTIPDVRDLLIAFGNKFNKMLSDDQQFENIDFIVDEFQSNL